ncbi:MAG: YbhB/YbcL family Raf kinase inhibitor-like protein [Patescibacteria group bacterium]
MLTISSTRFKENALIPQAYTCDGENTSPALSFRGTPEGAKSLVLIMDDPDIPQSVKDRLHVDVIDHWVVFDIPSPASGAVEIEDGATPPGIQGNNTHGSASYLGPCPPDREHRYFFKLYALDRMLELFEGATRVEVERAIHGHVLESAELIGRYERPH